jgi:hypothetical protein
MAEERSCVVEVVNRSELALDRSAATAEHGEFVRGPRRPLGAGDSDVFMLTNRSGNPGAGCGGYVEYVHAGDLRLTVRFDKPFAGRDSAQAEVDGVASHRYECSATLESDETSARCRFVFRRRMQ